jgi:hypothetical protein
MILGKYKIEDYIVTINGVDETRQKVTYYNIEGEEVSVTRFNGNYDEIDSNYLSFDDAPLKVTRWQFRTQLAFMPSPDPNFTNLRDLVSYMITQMSGNEKVKAEEAWTSANYISKYSPLVLSMAQALGLSDSDVDQIFIEAYKIEI